MAGQRWLFAEPLKDTTVIGKVESIIGQSFPADFVEFILQHNAGCPKLCVFDTARVKERVFSRLLSFDENDKNNIFFDLRAFSDIMPKTSLVPFAIDPFGNCLCFDYNTTPPTVVFWDHEVNETEFVASTFTELLSKLYDGEDIPD